MTERPKIFRKHVPDWSYLACDGVFKALGKYTPQQRLQVLEQCVDYQRQEIADLEDDDDRVH